jgi:hypothetical protein
MSEDMQVKETDMPRRESYPKRKVKRKKPETKREIK